MNYVVGDIHGEIKKLETLLDNILKEDSEPHLIFIGDYLDKGSDPKLVLDLLYNLYISEELSFDLLMGNHEFYWLKVKPNDIETQNYLLKYGGQNTIDSFKADDIFETQNIILQKYATMLFNMKLYAEVGEFIVTHSGIAPEQYDQELKQIPEIAFLFNRYNFISSQRYYNEKRIIFGHTGFYYPYIDNYKIGIDTAACFFKDQPLTAFNTEDEYFIDSLGYKYPLRLKNNCPNIVRCTPYNLKKR